MDNCKPPSKDHGKYGYSLNKLRELYNPHVELNFDELEALKIHEISGPNVPWTSAVTAFGGTLTKPYIPHGKTEYV